MIYKTLHIKLKIEQHEPSKNSGRDELRCSEICDSCSFCENHRVNHATHHENKEVWLNWILLIKIVPDEGYSRNVSCALNSISTFYYYDCVDTSTGELLIPRVYHQTMTHWLDLLYIYYWNLQEINSFGMLR